MTRQRLISIIFANVAGFIVCVWLMLAWVWSSGDELVDNQSDTPTMNVKEKADPGAPLGAEALRSLQKPPSPASRRIHTNKTENLSSVSRRGVSDLLKSHAPNVSRCAQHSHLLGVVRNVDVTVSVGPTSGGESVITGIEPRQARDSRWTTFSDCLMSSMALVRFADSEPRSFPVSVRIP